MDKDGLRVVSRIVVAVALRPESVGAAEVARAAAARIGAELHVVHVIEPISPSQAEAIPGSAEAHERHGREEADRFIASHDLAGATSVRVVVGDPVRETLRVVRELDADLLCFGRLGEGADKNHDLGSVANRLIAKSPVSCLVVPQAQRGTPARVGVAVDFTEGGEAAARRGARAAARLGLKEVVLLHAYQLPRGYHTIMSHEEACDRLAEVAQGRSTLLAAHIEGEGVAIRLRAAEGDIPQVVASLAIEEKTELLVVRVHKGKAAFIVGRHAEAIIRRAPCAVWVEKPADGDAHRADAVDKLLAT